ncbi:TPR repeat region-containing protein, partial [Mycobacterium kansasii]
SVLNSITADQRAGKAPLTPDQASVLSQLQAQQHGMSIEELSTAEQRLGDQRDMVANSWQLMSNPALTVPRTDLEPGALQGIYMVNG